MQLEARTAGGPFKIRRNLAKVLLVALLPVAMAGCEHDQAGTQVAGWALVEPEQRHPILVSQEPTSLTLHVAPGSYGLTASQRSRLVDFISHNRAGDAGNSRFVIAAPGGSANESAAMEAADEVRQMMLRSGYAESSIAVEAYHAGGREAPLRVSYMRYVADPPDCGQDWSQNLARTYQNTPYPNFGCAGQRNLAVMLANPADLLGPRTMTPRDADRRDDMYAKYIHGQPVGAAEEAQTIAKPSAE
jgi:pilus assembly protein CpaD